MPVKEQRPFRMSVAKQLKKVMDIMTRLLFNALQEPAIGHS